MKISKNDEKEVKIKYTLYITNVTYYVTHIFTNAMYVVICKYEVFFPSLYVAVKVRVRSKGNANAVQAYSVSENTTKHDNGTRDRRAGPVHYCKVLTLQMRQHTTA